jgi:hypothetical protein
VAYVSLLLALLAMELMWTIETQDQRDPFPSIFVNEREN